MQTELKQENPLVEGVIWKQLLFFFFPILLGTFFQQMYNTVDTIIVGRFVGTQALAAVGSTSSLVNLISRLYDVDEGAVYVGGSRFGARAYANNLTEEELLELLNNME